MEIKKIIDQIFQKGPDRIMIRNFITTSPERATKNYGINPDIIFIRNDGWSIGAPKYLELHTYLIWKEDWTHCIIRPNKKAITISKYCEKKKIRRASNAI